MVDHRRSAVRTAAVWAVVEAELGQLGGLGRVVDLGGGTGGFAVRLAGLGHQVTVVDPSPDALAALDRRAAESGLAGRMRGVQGDASDLVRLVGEQAVDLVLCHGVLEVVDDPADTLAATVRVLQRGGALSLLVAHRPAAVLARALAGRLDEARTLLREGARAVPRRFTEPEVRALLAGAGVADSPYLHGVRVFADLVPGVVVDSEPGAVELLHELELLASDRPELRTMASQLHVLARRR
ncbi:MAG: methyltransferase domain-containing protein [Nocardioidaceae bacterium]|nr:methyltransferase domain-containing protein [Nocardioidaceae bacterium]